MICKVCGLDKATSEFYSTNKSKCKDCLRIIANNYRLEHLDKVRQYDRNRPNKSERTKKSKEYKDRMRIENPEKFDRIFHGSRKNYRAKFKEKQIAVGRVNYALKTGKLIRPANCSVCGVECKPHAHHSDYSKPLDIVWVCIKCHVAIHNKKRNCSRFA